MKLDIVALQLLSNLYTKQQYLNVIYLRDVIMDCLDESLGLSGRDDVLECLVHVVEETNHLIRYRQFLPLEVQWHNINLQSVSDVY